MKLGGIMIGSEDPKQLGDFYARILDEKPWHDGDWYGFKAGGTYITVGPHSEVKGRNQSPGRIMLMFDTHDVQGEFERIKALGTEVIAEPYSPGEAKGMKIATFADPDGNYFQLATPWKAKA